MNARELIKKLVLNFFVIFAAIVLLLTLLRQIFTPDRPFALTDMYIYMICALVADLTTLITFTRTERSEREMRIRLLLQFIVLEAVLLTLALVAGWIHGAQDTIVLAIQIAIVAVIVRFLVYRGDQKMADRINERLKEVKKEP